MNQAPIAAGAGSGSRAEGKAPNRLFDPTPVIPTVAISPIDRSRRGFSLPRR